MSYLGNIGDGCIPDVRGRGVCDVGCALVDRVLDSAGGGGSTNGRVQGSSKGGRANHEHEGDEAREGSSTHY